MGDFQQNFYKIQDLTQPKDLYVSLYSQFYKQEKKLSNEIQYIKKNDISERILIIKREN